MVSAVSVETLQCWYRLSVYNNVEAVESGQCCCKLSVLHSVMNVSTVQCCCRLSVYNSDGVEERYRTDAVVFAVGVKAMDGIVAASTSLAACPVGIFLSPIIPPFVYSPALSVFP